jgi:hypothetical protein
MGRVTRISAICLRRTRNSLEGLHGVDLDLSDRPPRVRVSSPGAWAFRQTQGFRPTRFDVPALETLAALRNAGQS